MNVDNQSQSNQSTNPRNNESTQQNNSNNNASVSNTNNTQQATNNVQQNSTSNIKSQEEVQRIVAQAISTPEGDIYFKKFVRNMKTTMHIKIMEHHYLFMI